MEEEGHIPAVGPEDGPPGMTWPPALKPRERRSSATTRAEEEEEATQSAKAPVSEGSLLVVATTASASSFHRFNLSSLTSPFFSFSFLYLLIYIYIYIGKKSDLEINGVPEILLYEGEKGTEGSVL